MPAHEPARVHRDRRAAGQPGPVPERTARDRGTPVQSVVGQAKADPRSLSGADVRRLHRTIGNRSVGALLGGRPKLRVGPATDVYEREADRVANDVVRRLSGASPTSSTHPAPGGTGGGANGQPLDPGLQRSMGEVMGADFRGVRVHTGRESDRLSGALRARAFTVGQDVFFHGSGYDPHTRAGQELIAHELTHVVQQNGDRVRRSPADGDRDAVGAGPEISAAPGGQAQRKFGFEIELPMLFTRKRNASINVPTADNATVKTNLGGVPMDAGMNGPETHLWDHLHCYLNVDHSQTLDPLYTADIAKYAADAQLGTDATKALMVNRGRFMPNHASIVEVVTRPWDEAALTRTQASARVRSVIAWVDNLYDRIAGNRTATLGKYRIGSDAAHSDLFQPRIGYFHATYGVKLSQIPHLFEQTTQQRENLARYAGTSPAEKPHARNVEMTGRAVEAAQSALKDIKKAWPRVVVKRRKVLPDKTKVDLSAQAEKEFLGFLTLLTNYFLLMKNTPEGALAKQSVGMHYYKSDLYDVASNLPHEVIGPLRAADPAVLSEVIYRICKAVGADPSDTFNDRLSGDNVTDYLYQIFRGHFGVILKRDNTGALVPKRDAAGATFMDPVLADSINPWSNKLGPDQLGPEGNRSLGVVVENRHLEYLDPNYGTTTDAWNARFQAESAQYAPPKFGDDLRSELDKAMYASRGARESGPARKPIGEWESLMMGVYDMVKAINERT